MSHVYSRSHMRAAHTNKEKIHPWDSDIAKHFKTYKNGQRDGASMPTKDLSDGLKVCSCAVSRWVCREVIKKSWNVTTIWLKTVGVRERFNAPAEPEPVVCCPNKQTLLHKTFLAFNLWDSHLCQLKTVHSKIASMRFHT